jgi:23S rRNA pseudouridine1911/1915/1917 synthase
MTRNQKQNKSKAHINEVPNSKIAKLSYKRIQEFEHYCLLEVTLETGRHHQIRAQLSSLGFPIHGDLKYGADRSNKDGSISLHARKLQIEHPITNETVSFVANPQKSGIWKAVLSD